MVITDAGYGKVTWREGTKGKLSAKFAWVRVWPGQGWAEGACAGAEPIWLLIEERADGQIQYAFSNLPVGTSRIQAVRLWKSRWPVEQGWHHERLILTANLTLPDFVSFVALGPV